MVEAPIKTIIGLKIPICFTAIISNTSSNTDRFSGIVGVSSGTTIENQARISFPFRWSLTSLILNVNTNTKNADTVMTVRRNNANTLCTLTYIAAASGITTNNLAVPLVYEVGDFCAMRFNMTASASGNIEIRTGLICGFVRSEDLNITPTF